MNQSHLLQNDTRLPSQPTSSSKSSDAMDLVQLSGESAEVLDYFAAIHQTNCLRFVAGCPNLC